MQTTELNLDLEPDYGFGYCVGFQILLIRSDGEVARDVGEDTC